MTTSKMIWEHQTLKRPVFADGQVDWNCEAGSL